MKGKTIGNYEILDEIGEGGMGTVYKAKQARLERIVALKVLLPNLSKKKDFVERFMREARNAARLEHPNIVTIHEVGEEGDTYYFSMNYIEGRDIEDLLSGGPLDLSDAVMIVSQVASGLDHAHKKGVVHRDIKPANIIVDQSGRAVITDFGIARAAWEEKLTGTGASMGTIEYMSPEQFKGGTEPDAKSDIYALGATFYRMVVGGSPFPGQTTHEVMYKKFNEKPLPPSSVNPSLPAWVDEIVMKAIDEDPGDRYGSAIEFANALRKGAGEAPIKAQGPVPTKEVSVAPKKTKRTVAGDEGAPAEAAPEETGGPLGKNKNVIIAAISAAIVIGVLIIIFGVIQSRTSSQPPSYGGGGPGGVTMGGPPPQPGNVPEPPPPPPPQEEYAYIVGDRVNVRGGPGLDYGTISEVNTGDNVTVIGRDVSSGSNEGTLVSRCVVSLDGGGTITLNQGHGLMVLGESGGSYRVQFDVKGKSGLYYGYVDKSYVRIISGNYWYHVRLASGTEGWIFSDYVKLY
jgi:hypothetical protein